MLVFRQETQTRFSAITGGDIYGGTESGDRIIVGRRNYGGYGRETTFNIPSF